MWALWLTVALAAPVTPDAAVAAALARDASVASSEAVVDAATGAAAQGGRPRSNPALNVQLGFGVAQHEVALTQALSVTGEGQAITRADRHALSAAKLSAARTELQVAADVRRAYVVVVAADAELALSAEALRLAGAVRAGVEGRLAQGEVGELDAHLARLDEGAAVEDWYRVAQASALARQDLAARTGLPLDVEVVADPLDASPAPSQREGPRADVAAAEEEAAAAAARTKAARAASFAPVEVGVWAQAQNLGAGTLPGGGVDLPAWDWRSNVGWSVGPSLTVQLPVWSANAAGRAAAEGDARAADAALEATTTRAEVEQQAAGLAGALAAEAEARTPGSLAGDADAALAAIQAAVDAGELGLIEASQLRLRVFDTRRRVVALRAELAAARIDTALAEEWPSLLGR
jgi:cobalt-zinc-cadmium efflux system outer membrane protein